MKRQLKKVGVLLLAAILLLSLSSCWDCRELDTICIVMGVGLDKAKPPEKIRMTLQIADTSGGQGNASSSSGTQKQQGSAKYFNAKDEGADIFCVLQKMALTLSRKLNFTHGQIIVYGEELAKEGVQESFDNFSRSTEVRMTMYVFVAKGKAEDIMYTEPTIGDSPVSELTDLIKDPVGAASKTIIMANEFSTKLMSETTSAVAPLIDVRETDGKKHIYVTGCAIFKGDKLAGELNAEECRGYQWLKSKVKYSEIDAEVNGYSANIIVYTEKCKITPVVNENNEVTILADIHLKGTLTAQTSPLNFAEPENTKLLNKCAEDTVRQEVELTLKRAQELGTDIFGFGEELYRRCPKQWKILKPQWEEIFKTLNVKLKVTVEVTGTGRITKPMKPYSGKE